MQNEWVISRRVKDQTHRTAGPAVEDTLRFLKKAMAQVLSKTGRSIDDGICRNGSQNPLVASGLMNLLILKRKSVGCNAIRSELE